jgi:RHS repeat-associated protein
VTDLVSALIAGVSGLPGGAHPSAATLAANSTVLSDNVTQFLSDTAGGTTSGRPLAFVNWVLFDNQFNYVAESSGFQQVGADNTLTAINKLQLPVSKSGYLYIYLSNETQNVDVFFDNLQVTHVRGPLLEEDHYYPFGLTISGISDKTFKTPYKQNKLKGNGGSELQDKEFSDGSGLELYDAMLRGFDPQIGRFLQIDPLSDISENKSAYSFVDDNPISFNDPVGLTDSIVGLKPYAPAPIITPPPAARPKAVNIDLAQTYVYLPLFHSLFLSIIDNSIVKAPTWWQRFVNGPMYQGKNLLGFEVYKKYYGGEAPTPSFYTRFNPKDILKIYKVLKEMQWTSRSVAQAAKLLLRGAKEVTVKNKEEAEELYLALYQAEGYTNTTGRTTKEMKDAFLFPDGKAGTYHWDLNDTQHGGIPHLQIHDTFGKIIRIFFGE